MNSTYNLFYCMVELNFYSQNIMMSYKNINYKSIIL